MKKEICKTDHNKKIKRITASFNIVRDLEEKIRHDYLSNVASCVEKKRALWSELNTEVRKQNLIDVGVVISGVEYDEGSDTGYLYIIKEEK